MTHAAGLGAAISNEGLVMRFSSPAAWRECLAPVASFLEESWLPAWLPERRWFQSKSQTIQSFELVDGVVVQADTESSSLLTLLKVTLSDGAASLYQLPLRVVRQMPSDAAPTGLIGTHDAEGRRIAVIDGLATAELPRLLVGLIAGKQVLGSQGGRLEASATCALDDLTTRGKLEPVRLSQAEQSHSNVVFGRRLLLKVFRKLDAGLNPDIEIGRYLTEKSAFRNAPRLAGDLQWRLGLSHTRGTTAVAGAAPGEALFASAILQEFLPSRGQGWEYMLDLLEQLRSSMPGTPEAERIHRQTLDDAALLGRRTAELHGALAGMPAARGENDHPPQDTPDQLLVIRGQLERTSQFLTSPQRVDSAVLERLRAVLAAAEAWLGHDRPAHVVHHMRIHGDLHLGQTLRTEDDFVFLDFEGEPSKPIEVRRKPQSPLRDVAGMLRSFDYAGHAAVKAARRKDPAGAEEFEEMIRAWIGKVCQAFLAGYEGVARGCGWYPEDPGAARGVLDAYLVEKALYELEYELNNRPDWVEIPLAGLERLVASEH
jgi:trehalose synthase-fused probable maltokinase